MPDWGWTLGSPSTSSNTVASLPASSGGSGAASTSSSLPFNPYNQGQGGASGGRAGATIQTVGSPPPLPNPGGTDSNGYTHADPHWTPQEQADYEAAANSGDWARAQQINDAAWKNYDQRRATATAIQNSYNSASNNPAASGVDYNAKTGQWSYYDTKGKKWVPGSSIDDIYNKIFTADQRSQHPLFYYQNMQQSQDAQEKNDIYNRYQQSQNEALMSSPTVRYQPVRF